MSKGSLENLVPKVDLALTGSKVIITLLCTDRLAARVLYDDIHDKMTSDAGLRLDLHGRHLTGEKPA